MANNEAKTPSVTGPTTSIRPATPDDARALAELVDMAGEGLPAYLWARMAEPGEDIWQVGERRARREEGSFSYRNAHVAEVSGAVAGALIGYALPDEPVAIGADFPAMFVPLQELENLVPGSWYVNVLAVYPRFRGRGLGGRLLDLAESVARAQGRARTSIIVFDRNEGARRLYARHGYREVARRPMVKEDWVCESEESLLLIKDLAAA